MKVCDSRRKQKWIDDPTPIPPTPPRSPSVIPEPLLDDLLELWVGVGMDESTCKLNDISFQSAYEYLNGELSDEPHELGGSIDLDAGDENEKLLDRLMTHRFDDSPPPTNPASPREMNDQEIEFHSEGETVAFEYCEGETTVEFKTEVETEGEAEVEFEEEIKQEPVEVSSVEEMEMDDWMECDPLATDPLAMDKTEQITSEFSSHMFDSYFQNILTVDEKPPALLTEGDAEECENPVTTPSMSAMINYSLQSFSNDVEIKHDCMWAGSCESDSHQEVFEELFGTSLAPRIDSFYGDDDTEDSYDMSNQSTTTGPETEEETDVDLEEEESNLEVLRSKILGDHSYAFNGYGPIHSQPQQNSSSQSSTQSVSSAQTSHTIPGILLKQEESSPKKTKIIVPLKDLMETLRQKSFLVAPLGPGKNVIRLTGNGETVKGVFDLGAKFKSAALSSASGLSISSSGSFSCSASLATSGKGTLKKSSPKLKKAVHKPKQELSPASPVTSSNSRNSSSSSPFSSQHSNSSSSSSNSSNTNTNSHLNSVNSSTNISSISNSSSTNPSKPRKAKTHNNMERMRRIDLRNSFDTLRKLVPVLSKANKCSKVEILKSATEYINGLKVMEKKILREEHALKLRNESLRNKLALLTSSST